MKLKKLISKLREIFYSSCLYFFYENYILSIPLFKIIIDFDYLGESIRNSYFYKLLYRFSEKLIIRLPKLNIDIGYLKILLLVIIAFYLAGEEAVFLKIIIVIYTLIYVLKNKNTTFFSVSLLSGALIILIQRYGAKNVAAEGFSLWCCVNVFYLTYKCLENERKNLFLRYIFYINILISLISFLSEKNILYGKMVLYLLPFSLSYTVCEYKKFKKLLAFFLVTIISVLTGVREGSVILSAMALEIVLFCALYNPKYIFLFLFTTPVAVVSLIRRFLIIRREFFLAGITFDNIISVVYTYINNGLKGDVISVKHTINQSVFEQMENISPGEQFFVYSVLIFIFITVIFLGRYIFRLIRKTFLLYGKKENNERNLITAAISFFFGTSFIALLSSLSGSINTMVMYWILLGFIKSLHKNTDKP